ncbi:MAG: hydroxysqualene dehydroxylase HpnE [Ignavibacteriaceae bacterium]|nr:hydroxysqualene dehydroxylase HpnE [Ignavibacteriaceae bacterium]MCW8814091.1 hydroxysqualene dehydroxylase HpnE [Chlorobium sp.]MCW8824598.1 hydroxysqualene dehydroxylase HpnE [Ignavibacteriaceae bacterium]MCW9097875.1 hydroxysqualene dehydroxylase HpnE [Ignavibacteriaceae bacterium]
MIQRKVIVIGGGLAGLTASAYLAKNNYKATLIESSPKLGGRTYSFLDKETNTVLDNGQHILMGCYFETLNFLSLIQAKENFYFQKRLEVNFVKEGFRVVPLKSLPVIYPLNLLLGVLRYKAINFSDRLSLIKVFLKVPFYSSNKLSRMNIKEWLENENQSKNVQDAFWRILAIGALNTSFKKASAKIFVDIIRQIFLTGKKAATIILPKFGLTESFCRDAEEYIINNGGEILFSETALKLVIKDDRITEVHTSNRVYTDFDFIITAIPAFALSRVLDEKYQIKIPEFNYSTILNIHLWLKENSFPKGFFGLINSPLHWVFNKGTHLNIVISDAEELASKSDEDLILMVKSEVQKFFLLNPDIISNYKIIKEKRATFIPSNYILDKRPQQKTKIKNLILAGDWVDTGLPSTIESAVKSGRVAADLILNMK